MRNLLEQFRRFMMGRYGVDQLSRALMIIGIVCIALQWITNLHIFSWLILALLALVYFRMFSRNLQARYAENQQFLSIWNRVKNSVTGFQTRITDKTHRYYRCPSCKKRLRVPKGRGKINITCPQCRTQFVKKS